MYGKNQKDSNQHEVALTDLQKDSHHQQVENVENYMG
jgi:hypothetical protein